MQYAIGSDTELRQTQSQMEIRRRRALFEGDVWLAEYLDEHKVVTERCWAAMKRGRLLSNPGSIEHPETHH